MNYIAIIDIDFECRLTTVKNKIIFFFYLLQVNKEFVQATWLTGFYLKYIWNVLSQKFQTSCSKYKHIIFIY